MKAFYKTLALIACCVLSGYTGEVTAQAGPSAEGTPAVSEEIWDLYAQAFERTCDLRGPEGSNQRVKTLAGVMTNHPPTALIRLSPVQRPGLSKPGVRSLRIAQGSASMGAFLGQILRYACDLDRRFPQNRIIVPEDLASARYDYIDTMSQGGREVLQRALKEQFGVVARWEMRSNLVLSVKNPAIGLHKHAEGGDESAAGFTSKNMTMRDLAGRLSKLLGVDVADQTQLAGGYDFTLNLRPGATSDETRTAILSQLGLQLTPAANGQQVEFLVAEKVQGAK